MPPTTWHSVLRETRTTAELQVDWYRWCMWWLHVVLACVYGGVSSWKMQCKFKTTKKPPRAIAALDDHAYAVRCSQSPYYCNPLDPQLHSLRWQGRRLVEGGNRCLYYLVVLFGGGKLWSYIIYIYIYIYMPFVKTLLFLFGFWRIWRG